METHDESEIQAQVLPREYDDSKASLLPPQRSRDEIDTEKAMKPRIDLIPARALLAAKHAQNQRCTSWTATINNEDFPGGLHNGLVEMFEQLWMHFKIGVEDNDPDETPDKCLALLFDLVAFNELGKIPTDPSPYAWLAGGRAFAYGAQKHGLASNGRGTYREPGTEQSKLSTHIASFDRHWAAYRMGEATDPESGLGVLDHCVAQLAIVADLWENPVKG